MLLMCGVFSVLGTGNLSENEKLNFDAVTKIHSHLDDDRNGKVDLSESNEVSPSVDISIQWIMQLVLLTALLTG